MTTRRVRYDRSGRELPSECSRPQCHEVPKGRFNGGPVECAFHWRQSRYAALKTAKVGA
jgi:hypothetical protein